MSKIILETLSPVHIGSGEKYSGSEFLIKSNEIIRLDVNKIFTLLNQKDKDILVDYLEDPNFRMEDFLKGKNIPISEAKLYSLELKAGIPNEINEHIKTDFKGYIPGSSLKGAVKTAILSAFIGDKEVNEIGSIFSISNQRQRDREADEFIRGVFSSNGGKKSSYSDFMRFVQISDFVPVRHLHIRNVQSLEAEGNNWIWYRRNGRIVQTYLEAIEVGDRLEGEIHLTYKEKIFQRLGMGGKRDILDLTEIKRLIHSFSSNIIEHEISFSKRYNIDFLLNFYEHLKKVNKEDSPLIKLGQGAGYLATTIGLELKRNPAVFDDVRKSLRGKSYSFEFPKTRKIVVEEKMPLGWCRLI